MYRLIIMLGLLSLLIFMGLLSSFNNTDNSYDLKINNMEYTSKGFIDNKEIIKSLISKKQFQNLIKDNDFLEVEAKLKEIKSIENIDIYRNRFKVCGDIVKERDLTAFLYF